MRYDRFFDSKNKTKQSNGLANHILNENIESDDLYRRLHEKYIIDHAHYNDIYFKRFLPAKKNENLPAKKNENNIISFDQNDVINKLDNFNSDHATLRKLNNKYKGLCEVVSNYVIAKDLLGHKQAVQDNSFYNENKNQLKININLKNINQKEIRHSHILHTSNIIKKILAIFFEVYPHSITKSNVLKKNLENNKYEINARPLTLALNKLSEGSYIKFMAFRRKGMNLDGHSMVIKKTSFNRYSFFDPNQGEFQNLSKDELYKHLNNAISNFKANRVAFIDGKKYIKDIGLDKIEKGLTK